MNFLGRNPVVLAVLSQMIFSIADFLARANLRGKTLGLPVFMSWWAPTWVVCHMLALCIQLYLFTTVPLGRAIGLMALVSLLLSNLAGFLFLSEVLTPIQYAGLILGVGALICLSWG